jgi:Protein of unknown function (DUF3000)
MRLADTPAPARAGAQANAAVQAGHHPSSEPCFDAALAAFAAGRDAVASTRDDIELEDWPAPRKLAPHAFALAATAYRDGEEAGTGKLVLLYDPDGQDGWTGPFRIVCHVHADVEEEMAADPLLGEVGWSWLTDALDLHAPGYAAPSGTVTREITEGFGTKSDEPPATAFELRASWCPGPGAGSGADSADIADIADELSGAVVAWCELLAAAAGLPAQGTVAISVRPGHARSASPSGRRVR